MKVVLSPRAERQLRKLSKINQIAVVKKIRSIRGETAVSGEEKLKGFRHIFRVRVGDHRIVYKRTRQSVYIVLIRHRKDVYRLVRQLLR
ncbi:type II toxin-antitoxin system RelE/ParE family toxin [Candidatus Parcubacteria bacterium]|nr:type II toxin-antitoxin system RelE/ParE family toxin [Candidatus Parcubacteria bacterium]